MGIKPLLHIISHTDLDGVTAAALAWHANRGTGRLLRVSLTGYGDVDNLILETLRAGEEPLVLDLFCQREQTVDEIDGIWDDDRQPFLFDHHKSTFERYGNRKWAVIDTNYCGAMVYWNWLMAQDFSNEHKARIAGMEPLMRIANDRDLWLGEMPESRLWQGLVTMCGHWGTLMRLVTDPSSELTPDERSGAEDFVAQQEERFSAAKEKIIRTGNELSFVCDGILEFGDVSDFCGLILDREPDPPLVAAVAAKRMGGDWAVSMRSRDGFAGRVMALLKDGKKVRGGGHGDASALYFPHHYSEEQIRNSVLAAIRVEKERAETPKVTLGDLFKGLQA
ncbi:MAG: phosphohydrolase [Synergistaceae bacterium]|nr:phosphohydrolase [Synergistaceae bacterium]